MKKSMPSDTAEPSMQGLEYSIVGAKQLGNTVSTTQNPPNCLQERMGPYLINETRLNNSVSVTIPETQEAKEEPLPINFGESFSSTAIRHRFIRKVYTIVTLELLVTFAIVTWFSLHEPTKLFIYEHSWTIILSYCVFLVTYLTLICCGDARRKWPFNIILLSVFTLAMSYLLGAISATYETEIVFFAIGVTAVLTFLITLFAIQTKHDFTGYGVYLYVVCWVLFIFGIMAMIMQDRAMQMVYSGGIALLFSCYLVYDTQCIVGGRKLSISEEEHIFGALMLYYDVVMIFMAVLGLSRK